MQYKISGTRSADPRPYEAEHRLTARKAATQGMVLLKNEGKTLPLDPTAKVALYGAGAIATIKGGSGSGDVNTREIGSAMPVSLWPIKPGSRT